MDIAVLGGGSGTGRLLGGIKALFGWQPTGPAPGDSTDRVTAIVSTGGDIRLHNLHISHDLDACLYHTAGIAAADDAGARADETFAVATELERYGAEAPWFRLGDRDIATHLMRTRMLDAGYRLSQVTAALCAHWQTGVRLLPMTDDRVETHVVVADPHATADDTDAAGVVAIHLREWELRYGAGLPPLAVTPIGADSAAPAPGVLEAIAAADLLVIGPDNPVTVIGSVLAVPGVREALAEAGAPVIAISPLAGGQPLLPFADAGLAAEGIARSARGVAAFYGARAEGGLLDGFLRAAQDGMATDDEDPLPMRTQDVPLDLTTVESARAVAAAARELAGV